ncbi:MAG: hypothetical protein CML68_03595 [Rhodobacteraceae bacterium]|nr:hypothetical protein [Paracoccaceae bacterium]
MSFIRPEARAALMRWREVLIGAALAALGLSWAMGPGGLLGWIGWALALAGAALAVTGLRRMRFRQGTDGPGVVQVDEGKIAYFGPLDGGAVAASELERLILDPTDQPPCWVLEQPGSPALHIPVNAAGSEALFDAFGALPGLDTRRLLSHLDRKAPMPVVVWERRTARPPNYRLH